MKVLVIHSLIFYPTFLTEYTNMLILSKEIHFGDNLRFSLFIPKTFPFILFF